MSEPTNVPVIERFDSEMKAAYEELRPEWAKVLSGEMDRETYERIKAAVFKKYNIG